MSPSVKFAPVSVSDEAGTGRRVPRSGLMSLVSGSSRTPNVTSKSMSETSAWKLADADPSSSPSDPTGSSSLRSRSPMFAFDADGPVGSKFSFWSRNVSDFVDDA